VISSAILGSPQVLRSLQLVLAANLRKGLKVEVARCPR
jgi:hypothetical protein